MLLAEGLSEFELGSKFFSVVLDSETGIVVFEEVVEVVEVVVVFEAFFSSEKIHVELAQLKLHVFNQKTGKRIGEWRG